MIFRARQIRIAENTPILIDQDGAAADYRERHAAGPAAKPIVGEIEFAEIDGTPVPPDVFAAMVRSYDAGVAEFLDLAHVKPNTLGNVRMLLHL